MWRNLNLLIYRTIVAVPKANHVVIASCHNQILVGDVDAGNISFVQALNFLASYELVSLLVMRQTEVRNFAFPTCGDEPKTGLIATESYISDLLFQIERFVNFLVEQNTSTV